MDPSATTPAHGGDPDPRGPRRRRRARPSVVDTVAALTACAVALTSALLTPTFIRYVGAAGVLALGLSAALGREPAFTRRRLMVIAATGVCLLTVTDAGLVDPERSVTMWRPVAALSGYALLGHVLLRVVGRYRLFRGSDVIVEAVLVGAAVAVTNQVALEWWSSSQVHSTTLDAVLAAVPSLLVGVDVALIVIFARSITPAAIRQVPVVLIGFATVSVTAGHLLAAIAVADGQQAGIVARVAISAAAAVLGFGAIHAALAPRSPEIPHEVPLFSSGHAGIVGVSVLAAPLLVCLQVAWGLSVSGSVAYGSGLIGLVLAGHIVTLLRERATSEHQATHDGLTELPNRMLFLDRLERAIAHASRNRSPVGVLYIDLDRFKEVNDSLGHDAGDELLRRTAERLGSCARHEDTVARLAGDEFAVLLPHLAAADDVLVVAERMRAALAEPVTVAGHSIRNGGSIGVAVYPEDGSSPAEVVSAADAAMYRAKETGGCDIAVYSAERHEQATTRLELESSLRQAIREGQLVLHYQPIVEASDGRTCGAEALVRWNHPERGLLPPGEFVPVAEESDLIIELGDWVIQQACLELSRWRMLGHGDRFVSVNVSPRHFRGDIVSSATSALRTSGVDPSLLVVELTEHAAVDDVAAAAERLHELRSLGVRTAMDDFGTGYCGLKYLVDLPLSVLKLDRSFIQAETASSIAVVTATIAMAGSLGISLIAEGVETAEQRAFLERNGCERLQGFHLGRPMPSEDFVDRLRVEDAAARRTEPLEELEQQTSVAEPAQNGSGGVEPAHAVDAGAGWR
jgi:diguanylate cyclase (GGDEF)-like protein